MPAQLQSSHHWQDYEEKGEGKSLLPVMTEQMQTDLTREKGKGSEPPKPLSYCCSKASGNQWNIFMLFQKDIKWHHFYSFSVQQIHLCPKRVLSLSLGWTRLSSSQRFKKFLRVLLCPSSILSITLARSQNFGRPCPGQSSKKVKRQLC